VTVNASQRSDSRLSGRYLPQVAPATELRANFVKANGEPAEKPVLVGTDVKITSEMLTFKTDRRTAVIGDRLLVSLVKGSGGLLHSVVVVNNVVERSMHVIIEASFAVASYDVLAASNLKPGFDIQSKTIRPNFPSEVLDGWVELGILRKYLMNRVRCCPKCQCLATFRTGCPACGSLQTAGSKLIHHFACAHVAKVSEFECQSELVCPKCRLRKLVVGADFEFLDGNFQCFDCDWRGSELGVVGGCLGCELIFPFELAHELDVYGYDVQRLDPLAFIDSA